MKNFVEKDELQEQLEKLKIQKQKLLDKKLNRGNSKNVLERQKFKEKILKNKKDPEDADQSPVAE